MTVMEETNGKKTGAVTRDKTIIKIKSHVFRLGIDFLDPFHSIKSLPFIFISQVWLFRARVVTLPGEQSELRICKKL